MVTWEEPDNFVSGEYVVIKAVVGGNSYYTCVVLMEDPEYDKDCLCRSLETENEFRVSAGYQTADRRCIDDR